MRAWTTTLIAAAALAFGLVAPAAAGPAIDWDPVFFYGSGITPTNSPLGSQLIGVGTVSSFGPPLEFLNPNIGPYEYTIYVFGLISQGTSPGPFYVTNYNGGFIEIREDTTPDASYDPNPPAGGVPGDFQDGTVIHVDSPDNHGVGGRPADGRPTIIGDEVRFYYHGCSYTHGFTEPVNSPNMYTRKVAKSTANAMRVPAASQRA